MTKTIEFDDIRVGDRIRATQIQVQDRPSGDSSTTIYDFSVIEKTDRKVESGDFLFLKSSISSERSETTFELLERKIEEPTGAGAVVQFLNEVGMRRVYVRVYVSDYESLRWYSTNHGFESWSRIASRAAAGTFEVVSEGVEL